MFARWKYACNAGCCFEFLISRAPPATFPRAENKLVPISLPEDVYIKKFFQKYPESKHEDAIKYGLLTC